MMATLSMLACGPHTRRPTKECLDSVRTFLLSDTRLQRLARDICNAERTRGIVAGRQAEIAALSRGPRYAQAFQAWIDQGESKTLLESRSGIIALPLLVVIQLTQYLQYLQLANSNHVALVDGLRRGGGIQGYCAGLLPAYAIACSKDEDELIKNAGTAFQIAFAIGLYQEIGDDENIPGATSIVLRLSTPGEGDEIVAQFPGCYISAVTDPRTLSIVGDVSTLKKLCAFARSKGLIVQEMDLRGKIHNPENMELARELCTLCDEVPFLQLPRANQLQSAMYSNRTGRRLENPSLTHEAIYTILTARCEWYTVLEAAADKMKSTGIKTHSVACLGLGDTVPLSAFHQFNLSIAKIDVSRLLRHAEAQRYEFNDDAIAVVGAACRLPGADDLDELWELIVNARSRCESIRQDRVPINQSWRLPGNKENVANREYYGNFINNVDQFDHGFFRIGSKEASYMDPQQRILLQVAYEALDSSGYLRRHDRQSNDNVGCFIGCCNVEYLENTSSHPPSAFTSTGTLRAFLAGRLSYYFGWRGPAETIDTACSSSLVAIHRACRAILGGECLTAIAGGVNLITGVTNYLDLGKAGFLSPTGQCKPFDASADGYCRADGAGIVVLKRLAHAERDGDQILGVLTGTATNQCGLSNAITVPDRTAQVELFEKVLDVSGMTADHISYIEAHGTGTQAGDPIEISSIRHVFGGVNRLSSLQIGALKGNIGHCEAAAGVASLLKILSMLKSGVIPPVANFKKLNPKIPPLVGDKMTIAQSIEMWSAPTRAACINSYGAAGSNAALICCEYRHNVGLDNTSLHQGRPLPMLLSAHSQDSLLRYMNQLDTSLSNRKCSIDNLAYTLSEKRARHRFRWMTVAPDVSTVKEQLRSTDRIVEVPSHIKPLVLVFAGQTKQTVMLDRTLYDTSPRLKHYVDACEQLLREFGFPSIIPAIFNAEPISDLIVLQTATFAAQYACARCWMDGGLKVAATIGHSFGELTALVVSGVWTLRDGIRIIATRARLMAQTIKERGVMLAVHDSVEVVQEIMSQVEDCEIACYNAQMSQVVVGSTDSIGRVESLLQNVQKYRSIRFQRLDVGLGFHSKFMEPVQDGLLLLAKTIPIYDAEISLSTCTLQQRNITQDHIVRHVRDPVYFEAAIRRIEDRLGPCIWLEAGVDSPIISMVKRAVRNSNAHEFQPLRFSGSKAKETVLPNAVMNLWLWNIDVTFWPFLTPREVGLSQVLLPPYPFKATSSWVKNIDHTTELILENRNAEAQKIIQQPLRLVTGLETVGKEHRFVIHGNSTRFQAIVSAHKMRGRPFCPASMYMECAAMCAQLSEVIPEKGVLSFQNLRFEHPLGINPDANITFTLKEADLDAGWDLSLQSHLQSNKQSAITPHFRGHLEKLAAPPNLTAYHRMIARSIAQLLSDSKAERLMKMRTYALFSRVVEYGEALRGIDNIVMRGNQAVAEIQMSGDQVGVTESTAVGLCNAVSLDVIFQVAGLLVNTSDQCDPDSVFAATGLETATLPGSAFFSRGGVFKVYVETTIVDRSHAAADVFVLESDNTLALSIIGVSFTKLPIEKVVRLLDGANPTTTPTKITSTTHAPSEIRNLPQKATLPTPTPARDIKVEKNTGLPPSGAIPIEKSIEGIISDFTGAPVDVINDNTMIMDLGLDSLAAVELAEDLSTLYKQEISPLQLLEGTLKELRHLLCPYDSTSAPSSESSSLLGDQSTPLLSSPAMTVVSSPPSPPSPLKKKQGYQRLEKIVVEVSGASSTLSLKADSTLQELGIDSLGVIELSDDIKTAFSVEEFEEEITTSSTLHDIGRMIGLSEYSDIPSDGQTSRSSPELKLDSSTYSITSSSCNYNPQLENSEATRIHSPFEALLLAETAQLDRSQQLELSASWGAVSRCQDAITVAYILEAFEELGVNLSVLQAGDQIPPIPHAPRYARVVQRYCHILQKHNLIESDETGSTYSRTALDVPQASACELLDTFKLEFPDYQPDADIVSLTGPKLANCLSGRDSPVALLFSTESQKVLEKYYANSPILAASTELLVDTVSRVVANNADRKVRILEVGAGFGGTTKRLAQELERHGHNVEYVFTDISPTLVSRARKAMQEYKWMSFKVLNIEDEPPAFLNSQFDIVIATNCIHATTDPVTALRHVRNILHSAGLVILAEATGIIDWFDLVFGLLDGWWLRKDGSYALQPANYWERALRMAGFATTYHSQVPGRHLNRQQLILGTIESLSIPLRKTMGSHLVRTVVYKDIEGVQILADIYIPQDRKKTKMSLAMLIHGGGHLTLSRKVIRPAQVDFLLENDVVPISFDYRLCPQVNLINGPIADIRDAYLWMQTTLPTILERHGISTDATRIAVIGWSTGAHLAMTTAWTSVEMRVEPPRSILGFYGPTDFESGQLDVLRFQNRPQREIDVGSIIKSLPKTPITSYGDDEEGHGWLMKANDPRSALVVSLFQSGHGLSLLLNNVMEASRDDDAESATSWRAPPAPERVATICPLAHLRAGLYKTPTFIVHGTQDERVPFRSTVDFVNAARERDVECGLLAVPGARHLHDINLVPGTALWEAQVAPAYQFILRSLQR
ncbi:BcPKS16, polyketide synthase [Nemania serpens]|nr:BcPKS16, polyketide synthase [Nemania serpens]